MSDLELLNSYANTIKGLANLFGSGCEFVVHSVENLEHAVIAIENGQISGREVGAPITNVALEYLENEEKLKSLEPYISISPKGNNLRSITIPINNEDRLVGLLCININLDIKVSEVLQHLTSINIATTSNEDLSNSVEDMMANLLKQVESTVIKDYSIPNQMKNKEIISRLNKKGFFKLRGSTELLAERLDISPHTIYSILRKQEAKPLE